MLLEDNPSRVCFANVQAEPEEEEAAMMFARPTPIAPLFYAEVKMRNSPKEGIANKGIVHKGGRAFFPNLTYYHTRR